MTPDDIADRETLARWLEGRPRADAVFVAFRAALRVLPWLIADLRRGRGLLGGETALPVLRTLLATGVAQVSRDEGVVAALRDVAKVVPEVARVYRRVWEGKRPIEDDPPSAARSAWLAAEALLHEAAAGRAADAVQAAASLRRDDSTVRPMIWDAARDDARGLTARAADTSPLWPRNYELGIASLSIASEGWRVAAPAAEFWMRWYRGFLDGKPLPWDLQRDVALIPDEDWQKGEAHAVGLIEIIEERHRLSGLVAELRERLREAISVSATDIASPSHRSHNQPPGLIGDPIAFLGSVTLIRVTLDEAEAELAKPTPDPSALQRIAATLTAAVKDAAAYVGAKLDVFITRAAEQGGSAFGKWGVMAAIAYFATPTGTMSALIEGLTGLAMTISP